MGAKEFERPPLPATRANQTIYSTQKYRNVNDLQSVVSSAHFYQFNIQFSLLQLNRLSFLLSFYVTAVDGRVSVAHVHRCLHYPRIFLTTGDGCCVSLRHSSAADVAGCSCAYFLLC